MNIFYAFLVYPFEFIFLHFFNFSFLFTKNYGVSILVLSCFANILLYPLYHYAYVLQRKEREIRTVLDSQIREIKKTSANGQEQYARTQNLFKRYAYHPIYGMRAMASVFIQVPIFIAAYNMLGHYPSFDGVGFLLIKNLSSPDQLLWGINLLPILMTGLNIYASVTTKDFTKKDIYQAIAVAAVFLILLYNSPAALLLYWTTNNLISLLKNLAANKKNKGLAGVSPEMLKNVRTGSVQAVRKAFELLTSQIIFPVFIALLMLYAGFVLIANRWSLTSPSALTAFNLLLAASFVFSMLGFTAFILKFKPTFFNIQFQFLFTLFLGYVGYRHYSVRNLFADQLFFAQLKIFYLHLVLMLLTLPFYLYAIFKNQTRPQGRLVSRLLLQSASLSPAKIATLLFLSALTPFIFHASNNMMFLLGKKELGLFLLFPLVFAAAVFLGLCCLSLKKLNAYQILVLAAAFIISITLMPIIRNILKESNNNTYEFIPVFFICTYALHFILTKYRKVFLVILIAFCLVPSFKLLNSYFIRNDFVGTSYDRAKVEALYPQQLKDSPFIEKPNVYFFVYDGITDFDTLDTLDIDTSVLRAAFQKNGFKVYPKTHSLENASISSIATTLDIVGGPEYRYGHVGWGRKVYSGYNKTNAVFLKNGYETYGALGVFFTGSDDNYDHLLPQVDMSYKKMNLLVTLVRGIFLGEFKFDTPGLSHSQDSVTDPEMNAIKHDIIKNGNKPRFVVSHINTPGHTQNSGTLTEQDYINYKAALKIAEKWIAEDIAELLKHDPGAVMIFLSDHGAFLTADGYNMQNIPNNEITELMIRDRLGTMIAIRWPDAEKAKKYDKHLLLDQDIFPVIFSYLTDSEAPLALQVKRDVYYKNIIFMQNGVFKPYTAQ